MEKLILIQFDKYQRLLEASQFGSGTITRRGPPPGKRATSPSLRKIQPSGVPEFKKIKKRRPLKDETNSKTDVDWISF
jgi:hypothetical protein